LTAEDLIAIGVTPVGHRRKLLSAIAALGAAAPAAAPTATPASGPPPPTGAGPGRASPIDRDVLRPGGIDRTLHRDGPRRSAGCDGVVSESVQCRDPALRRLCREVHG